jgi:hypothetical protein
MPHGDECGSRLELSAREHEVLALEGALELGVGAALGGHERMFA